MLAEGINLLAEASGPLKASIHDYTVARFELRHLLADLCHHAQHFMAQVETLVARQGLGRDRRLSVH